MESRRSNYFASHAAKRGCTRAIDFCNDVLARKIATAKAPKRRLSVALENNIRQAKSAVHYRLVYDDLVDRAGRILANPIPILETVSLRDDYLLGLEIYSNEGDPIHSTLTELTSICEQQKSGFAQRLLVEDTSCQWHGGQGEGAEVPFVNMFLLRKCDQSRLCLADKCYYGDAYDDEYGEGTFVHNRFTIGGTGEDDGGVFHTAKLEVRMTLGGSRMEKIEVHLPEGYDEWVVQSVEQLLQMVESPAFASRWVQPLAKGTVRTAQGTQERKKARLMPPLPAGGDPLKLLAKTEIIQSRPPSLITHVLTQLEVKDLMRASEVCRDWYHASNDDRVWAGIYEYEPVLVELQNQYKQPCKRLYAQQVKSLKAAKARLPVIPRDEYRLATEIYRIEDPSRAIAASLHELDADAYEQNELLDFTLDSPIDINTKEGESVLSADPYSVRLFLVRKQDNKRLLLSDDCASEDCDMMTHDDTTHDIVLNGCGEFAKPRPDVFAYCRIDTIMRLQEVKNAESFDFDAPHTRKVESFRFALPDGSWASEPMVETVETLLQMVECPAYADSWK